LTLLQPLTGSCKNLEKCCRSSDSVGTKYIVTGMVSALVTANELLQKCAWYLDSCLLPHNLFWLWFLVMVMLSWQHVMNERVNERYKIHSTTNGFGFISAVIRQSPKLKLKSAPQIILSPPHLTPHTHLHTLTPHTPHTHPTYSTHWLHTLTSTH